MKKQLTIALMIVGLVFGAAEQQAYSYEDGDVQIWTKHSISGVISENIKVKLHEDLRYGDDIGEFFYSETGFAISFKINDWLSIAPNVALIYELDEPDSWIEEDRWRLDATLQHKFENGWKVKDRNRFTLRNKQVGENVFRYRNRLTVYTPWKFTEWGINPFISDEIFFEEHKDGIYRNRFNVGVKIGNLFNLDWLSGSLYYRWQTTDKDEDDWQDYHVIGIDSAIKF